MILAAWVTFSSFLLPAYSNQGNLSPVFCLVYAVEFPCSKSMLLDFNFSDIVKMLKFFDSKMLYKPGKL